MTDFDALAATWDDDPRRADRARRAADAIDEAVGLTHTMRLLEYGAGTGQLGMAMADRVGELLMIDSSPAMVEAARRRIEACDHPNQRAGVGGHRQPLRGHALFGGAGFLLLFAGGRRVRRRWRGPAERASPAVCRGRQ